MNTVSQSEATNVVYGLYCVCPECVATPERIRYVGKTVQTATIRLRGHRSKCSSGTRRPIYDWMRKHGPSNIRSRVLEIVSADGDLYVREQFWIDKMSTNVARGAGGLNLTDGGPGSTGMLFSGFRKANIARGRIGVHVSPESLRRLRQHPMRKLDYESVRRIKSDIWDGEIRAGLSRKYGVSTSLIWRIEHEKMWSDVPWPTDRPIKAVSRSERQVIANDRTFLGKKKSREQVEREAFSRSPMKIRDIRRIRELARNTELYHREIADMLPEYVSTSIVGKILRGERWAWVA